MQIDCLNMETRFVSSCRCVTVTSSGEIENEEWWEREDHPLLNDLILKRVFECVRRYDLKACRRVCKKWNILTIPHMRSTFKVIIYGTLLTGHDATDAQRISRQMDGFVKLFSGNELGIPFEKYNLEPFSTTDGVGQTFLKLCGKTAKEIHLNEFIFSKNNTELFTVEDISELLLSSPNLRVLGFPSRLISHSGDTTTKLLPNLNNLEKVIIRHDYNLHKYSDEPLFVNYSTILEELLSVSQKISEIEVQYNYKSSVEDTKERGSKYISDVLNVIEKLGKESSIQSLTLNPGTLQHVEILRRIAQKNRKGWNLKNFTILPNISSDIDTDTEFINLEGMFKNTLEYLNVCHLVNNLINFPKMPRLNSLTCHGVSLDPIYIDLNKNFPVLQNLTISFGDWQDKDELEFFSKFEICPTITTLQFGNYNTKIKTFKQMLRIFPNVKHLSLNVREDSKEILEQIWTQMTRLESLYILTNDSDTARVESTLTGIPTSVHPIALEAIRSVTEEFDKMTVQLRTEKILELIDQFSQLPSIRCLTNLRHFTFYLFSGSGWRLQTNMSDLTGYLAFYPMTHLRHLELYRCGFTPTCCERLVMDMGLESWIFGTNQHRKYIIPPWFIGKRVYTHGNSILQRV